MPWAVGKAKSPGSIVSCIHWSHVSSTSCATSLSPVLAANSRTEGTASSVTVCETIRSSSTGSSAEGMIYGGTRNGTRSLVLFLESVEISTVNARGQAVRAAADFPSGSTTPTPTSTTPSFPGTNLHESSSLGACRRHPRTPFRKRRRQRRLSLAMDTTTSDVACDVSTRSRPSRSTTCSSSSSLSDHRSRPAYRAGSGTAMPKSFGAPGEGVKGPVRSPVCLRSEKMRKVCCGCWKEDASQAIIKEKPSQIRIEMKEVMTGLSTVACKGSSPRREPSRRRRFRTLLDLLRG